MTLNEQIFAKVLEPMFPGEFVYEKGSERTILTYDYLNFKNGGGLGFNLNNLDSAFWLAEKVGLFQQYVLGKKHNNYQWFLTNETRLVKRRTIRWRHYSRSHLSSSNFYLWEKK